MADVKSATEGDILEDLEGLTELGAEELDGVAGGRIMIDGRDFKVYDRKGELVETFTAGSKWEMVDAWKKALAFAKKNGHSPYKLTKDELEEVRRRFQ